MGWPETFGDRGISPGFSRIFPAMDSTEGVIAWSGLVSGSKGNCLDVVSWSEVFGTARMEASKLATHQLPFVVFSGRALHSKISVTAGFDGVGSRHFSLHEGELSSSPAPVSDLTAGDNSGEWQDGGGNPPPSWV